jgi:hypothetical protein
MLPKGPEWLCHPWTPVHLTKKPLYLYYRNPIDYIQSILYNPLVEKFIQYTLFRLYQTATKAMCIYAEQLSGDVVWSMQVSHLSQNICPVSYRHVVE